MEKGLGRLQKCILKELSRKRDQFTNWPNTKAAIQIIVQSSYWGNVVKQPGPELNRRRASISQALRSLQDRGLVVYESGFGVWTFKDREMHYVVQEWFREEIEKEEEQEEY